ncbi:transglutaminase domain-containing protein [Jejudonia soesokkakensis]|uniref:Transglutaminase domain-containing protein n=1 Tax=Jejudonia soesokkakensis TaxID=1323432 RepID=A0ABW2MS92_9FLAO
MRNVFFYVLLLFGLSAYSQIGDVISSRRIASERTTVRTTSSTIDLKKTIQRLAFQITKNSPTEAKKAEAIFYWIASNIEYDTALRLDRTLQQEIYTSEEKIIQNVLKRKKALCGGYAFLFQALCQEVGIKAEVIHGYSKKYVRTSKNRKVDHTWNAVKIDGRWQLLDITMARSQSRTGFPDLFWFGTPPLDFIKSHYPLAIKWALVSRPISFEEFNQTTTPP